MRERGTSNRRGSTTAMLQELGPELVMMVAAVRVRRPSHHLSCSPLSMWSMLHEQVWRIALVT